MNLTNTTNIIVGNIPSPRRYRVPLLNFDLHSRWDEYADIGQGLHIELGWE
jgi:hypothetical protein